MINILISPPICCYLPYRIFWRCRCCSNFVPISATRTIARGSPDARHVTFRILPNQIYSTVGWFFKKRGLSGMSKYTKNHLCPGYDSSIVIIITRIWGAAPLTKFISAHVIRIWSTGLCMQASYTAGRVGTKKTKLTVAAQMQPDSQCHFLVSQFIWGVVRGTTAMNADSSMWMRLCQVEWSLSLSRWHGLYLRFHIHVFFCRVCSKKYLSHFFFQSHLKSYYLHSRAE